MNILIWNCWSCEPYLFIITWKKITRNTIISFFLYIIPLLLIQGGEDYETLYIPDFCLIHWCSFKKYKVRRFFDGEEQGFIFIHRSYKAFPFFFVCPPNLFFRPFRLLCFFFPFSFFPFSFFISLFLSLFPLLNVSS